MYNHMTDYVYEIHEHTMNRVKVSSSGGIKSISKAKGTPSCNERNKGDFSSMRKTRVGNT